MVLTDASPAAALATGIYNFDSKRFVAAPLDTRTEGWTESWGGSTSDDDDAELAERFQIDEDAVASSLLATPYPQLPLVLTQFRPAWLEQLVLRMAGVPHVVLNSQFVANEASGPLPYLQDRSQEKPVLVGRRHPSNISPPSKPCQNAILDYLMTYRHINLDHSLVSDRERSLSKCFLNMVNGELDQALKFLRYEDYSAWEQVYRQQYLHASSPNKDNWFLHLKGRFQASMERAAARRRLTEYSRYMAIDQAVARARDAYQAFELQLASHGKPYLMGNTKPSLVDAALWAHLAEALCDVHLIVVLADFQALIKYFQNIHTTFFAGTVIDKWDEWNREQNKLNAFQQLPFGGGKKWAKTGFKDAIELMQSLSLQNEELQEVLNAAKEKRLSEPWPKPTHETKSLLYRWRMGEDLNPAKKEKPKEEDPSAEMRKKVLRDQQRNDQIWLSGVAGVSVIALFLLQSASTDRESKK